VLSPLRSSRRARTIIALAATQVGPPIAASIFS
jgi:hypothetical protein